MAPDGHWVGRNGDLLYDDGIDDGKIYLTNQTYEHKGNIDELKENSYLVIDDGKAYSEYDIKDLVQSIAQKVDVTIGNVEIDSQRLRKEHKDFVEFKTIGLGIQRDNNGKVGVYLEKDPIVNIQIRNREDGTSDVPILKSYYNILNTLEHERSHVNDFRSYPLDSQQAKNVGNFLNFKNNNERRAVDYQKKTTIMGKNNS